MQHSAQGPGRIRAVLAVDAAFPEPANFEAPLVPDDVDARLLAAIERAAERRDLGLPPEHAPPAPCRDAVPGRWHG